MDVDISKVSIIVRACCALYNMCEVHGEWCAMAVHAAGQPEVQAVPQEIRQALTVHFSHQHGGQ